MSSLGSAKSRSSVSQSESASSSSGPPPYTDDCANCLNGYAPEYMQLDAYGWTDSANPVCKSCDEELNGTAMLHVSAPTVCSWGPTASNPCPLPPGVIPTCNRTMFIESNHAPPGQQWRVVVKYNLIISGAPPPDYGVWWRFATAWQDAMIDCMHLNELAVPFLDTTAPAGAYCNYPSEVYVTTGP
jgi:hypothetical protein